MNNLDKKARNRIKKLELEIELLEKTDKFFTTTVSRGHDNEDRIKACQDEIKKIQGEA